MESDHPTPGYATLGRVLWMGAGPMVLAVTTIFNFLEGKGWHTAADYVFFATLGAMVLGRWLEMLGGNPLTSEGQPATRKDFYQYVAIVLGGGVALWVVANAFGNQGIG